VLQFRAKDTMHPDGSRTTTVVPYIIDLASTNGTLVNAKKIPTQRFYELRPQDTLKFGNSSRDYVLMHADMV